MHFMLQLVNNATEKDFILALNEVPVNECPPLVKLKDDQTVPQKWDDLDLGSIMGTVTEGAGLPHPPPSTTEQRKFIVRLILFVTRSRAVPELHLSKVMQTSPSTVEQRKLEKQKDKTRTIETSTARVLDNH